MAKEDVLGNVTVRETITRELFDDIMCTAFDGGVGGCWYWIEDYQMSETTDGVNGEYFHDNISLGAKMTIRVNDPYEDDVDEYTLTREDVLKGFQLFCESRGVTLKWVEEQQDADVADCIVQFGLFGEIVYG
jgi:hypothetical protein